MNLWLIYTYLAVVCLFFFIYNIYLRKEIKVHNYFEDEIKKKSQKFYIRLKNKIITNIEKEDLECILKNIDEKIFNYKEFIIKIMENGFYLEKEIKVTEEIEILIDKIEDEHKKLLREKDKLYYFQKESAMKLGFILQDIYDFKTVLLNRDISDDLVKLENIESKLEFFVNFMYGKMNIIFRKYRVCYYENIVKFFENYFKKKITFKIDKNLDNSGKIYFEEEKFYYFFKAIVNSILKNKNENLEIEIENKNELLVFKIFIEKKEKNVLSSSDEEFFEISKLMGEGWNMSISENGEYRIEIPIKKDIYEDVKEEKQIEIYSDLKNIKTVERNIIYDMYSKGFTEKDGADMKLILDELLTNAIEHGNKYDILKKVIINYRFRKDEEIQVEICDEGEGFLIEQIKDPDSNGERGRGIFIVRKLADELSYVDNGKKVKVYKKRSIKNDSE